MKQRSIFVTALFLLLFLVYPVSAATSPEERSIVVFDSLTSDPAVKADILEKEGLYIIKDLPLINGAVVMTDSESRKSVSKRSEVSRITADVMAYTQAKGDKPKLYEEVLPWNIQRIGADQCWPNQSGSGVKVAVMDTGINLKHPDLAASISGGYNAIDPRKLPHDTYGHGTHVAGIIAAGINDIGTVGAAPEASLYAVKVLDINSGYLSDIIDGLQWCIDNDMQIINMSFSVLEDVPEFHAAIQAVYAQGILLVAAAGNYGPGMVTYPANYPEVIAVGAIDSADQVTPWSCQGDALELAAPGVDIYSTFHGVTYKTLMGTSMAAPHVTGTAALIISSGIADSNGDGNIHDDVRSRLCQTADEAGEPGRDIQYGFGIVNAPEALK